MDKTMFEMARKIIQSAIDGGMEVSAEEMAWLKEADTDYGAEKMTVAEVSEKLDAALNRPIQVIVNVDTTQLAEVIERALNRPVPTPIVTLNAPPMPPVHVNAQVQIPETSETIEVERDANGLIKSAKKTRRKKVA